MRSFLIRVVPRLGAAVWLCLSTAAFAQPEGVVPPKLLEHIDAPYPASKLREHVETNVVIFVTVGTDGSVSDVEVIESGGPDFDRAALETVKSGKAPR